MNDDQIKWAIDLAQVVGKLARAEKAGEGVALTAEETRSVVAAMRLLKDGPQ